MQGLVRVLPEECLNKHNHQSETLEIENLKAKHLDDTILDNQDIQNPFKYLQSDYLENKSSRVYAENPLKQLAGHSFDKLEEMGAFRSSKRLLIQPKYSAKNLEEQFQRIKVIYT
jgi:hypothetical protein